MKGGALGVLELELLPPLLLPPPPPPLPPLGSRATMDWTEPGVVPFPLQSTKPLFLNTSKFFKGCAVVLTDEPCAVTDGMRDMHANVAVRRAILLSDGGETMMKDWR